MSDNHNQCHVEGDYLVIPTKIALPQRCVVTNQAVPDDLYTTWDLPFIKGWLVFLVFGPFSMFFAPFVIKRRCKLRAALSASVRRKYMWKKTGLLLLGIAPFALVAIALFYQYYDLFLLIAIGPIISYLAVFAYIFLLKPLKVVKIEDDLFWVSGLLNRVSRKP